MAAFCDAAVLWPPSNTFVESLDREILVGEDMLLLSKKDTLTSFSVSLLDFLFEKRKTDTQLEQVNQ